MDDDCPVMEDACSPCSWKLMACMVCTNHIILFPMIVQLFNNLQSDGIASRYGGPCIARKKLFG